MKATFIFHSGYLIELADTLLLFDYFSGGLPQLPEGKRLFVFASHSHSDHYDPEIFERFREVPDVTYVLSWDIGRAIKRRLKRGRVSDAEREAYTDGSVSAHPVRFVRPGEQISLGNSGALWAFKSTDAGDAFLVRVEGKYIYHAGDLNDWRWPGEPEAENERMRRNYERQIDRLAAVLKEERAALDIAMIVLDLRLGGYYDRGMRYFLETIPARHVFPMHFFENGYGACAQFQKSDAKGKEKVAVITRPGMEFAL